MIRLLLAAVVLFAVFKLMRYLGKQPPEQRKLMWKQLGIGALLLVLILGVVTGHLHWLGAVLGTLLLLLKRLIVLAFKVLPFLQGRFDTHKQRPEGSQERPAAQQGAMSADEARQILGVEEGATPDDIVWAHRRLIQKLHPDRGGSAYLAAKLNQAKDVLLEGQKR